MKVAQAVWNLGNNALRAILFVALVLGSTPAAAAQAGKAKVNSATTAKASTGAKPSGGPHEGIKVHGHWVIEVRNPDGTLAARREFENALVQGADKLLAELLNGDISPGHWMVLIGSGTLCNPNGAGCAIGEAGIGRNANSLNLTAIVPTTGPNANKLVLSGSVKVSTAGDVTQVDTLLTNCAGSIAPASCFNPNVFAFVTSKFVSPTIPVQANQTLDITVVISFS
jgi:hypothetical protein